MPVRQSRDAGTFGAAFTRLLENAGLNPDKVLIRLGDVRGLVSRSTLYDWKKGEHLPEASRPVLEVVRICLRAARDRGVRTVPGDEEGWLQLLAAAKQARDSGVAEGRGDSKTRRRTSHLGRPIGWWDPVGLGVHRAIGGNPLPTYIRRPHDALLRAVLDAGQAGNRLVVLRGGSSTGKSRAAYEAVKDSLPDWRVDYPRTPDALRQRLQDGIARRTVLWLGELRDYAEAAGGTVALGHLAELLIDDGQVVVLTTLWPEHWAAYTSGRRDMPGVDGTAVIRGLLTPLVELTSPESVGGRDLSRGAIIDIPHQFTEAEVVHASQLGDPALSQAIEGTRGAGTDRDVTQYLAGVPDLLNHCDGPGADMYGQAVIAAAMDSARLGHIGPYTPVLLQDAVTGYLADRQRVAEVSSWWNSATAYATEQLRGAVQALEPVPPMHGTGLVGYKLADYLDQYGRHARQARLGPASLWNALAAHVTSPDDLFRLGQAARDRGLYRYAAVFWTRATTGGSTVAALLLLNLLQTIDAESAGRARRWTASHAPLSGPGFVDLLRAVVHQAEPDSVAILAASRAATHADVSDPWNVYYLLPILREAGAADAVSALATRVASQPDLSDAGHAGILLDALREAGAVEAVTALAARAPGQADLSRAWAVARLLTALREAGAAEAVRTLLARDPANHVDLDDPPEAIGILFGALHKAGALDAAMILADRVARRAELSDNESVVQLLNILREAGAADAVTVLAARAADRVDSGRPRDITRLIRDLRDAGAAEAVITLAARAVSQADLGDVTDIARLLHSLSEVGAADAVTALATRAAGHADLSDPRAVGTLLYALRAAGCTNAVTVLLARDPASHVDVSDAGEIAHLLDVLREARATDAVTALAARAAGHADLSHPVTIARLLEALREAGATEAVTALATRAVDGADLSRTSGIQRLLRALREAGATDAVTALAARAGADADLTHPAAIYTLLPALHEAGAMHAIVMLATRSADQPDLNDPSWAIAQLLRALREAGAQMRSPL